MVYQVTLRYLWTVAGPTGSPPIVAGLVEGVFKYSTDYVITQSKSFDFLQWFFVRSPVCLFLCLFPLFVHLLICFDFRLSECYSPLMLITICKLKTNYENFQKKKHNRICVCHTINFIGEVAFIKGKTLRRFHLSNIKIRQGTSKIQTKWTIKNTTQLQN